MKIPEMFETHPAVFAVDREYQIMIPVKCEMLMWITVNGEAFYDHDNGVLRSMTDIHRIKIPAPVLDAAGGYTVNYRVVTDRKAYNPESEDTASIDYSFRPVKGERIVLYHISDAHDDGIATVAAGKKFPYPIDALVLNGDIPNHSGDTVYFKTIYHIASELTAGEIPVLFSRGNHDMRGRYAERFSEYTPVHNGNSYYTFRLGALWGVILDCGEDKADTADAYGHTVCFSTTRKAQTAFLESIVRSAKSEYDAGDVKYRMVVSHIPFTYTPPPPCNIEIETYSRWAEILRNYVHPDLILSGHIHKSAIYEVGEERDNKGQPCPVIVGATVHKKVLPRTFTGVGLIFDKNKLEVLFTDETGDTLRHETIDIGGKQYD